MFGPRSSEPSAVHLRRRARSRWLARALPALIAGALLPAVAFSADAGAGSGGTPPTQTTPVTTPVPAGSPFNGIAMWIWELGNSSGGSGAAIVRKAKLHRVSTLFIKSSDGANKWQQFSPGLVAYLKAHGLHVCGWQYVYGFKPSAEAALGASAKARGADCLIIDAESEYEGRYAQAQVYINKLRSKVGPRFPVALAGFPYVDYHPAFPYSVFMGPGGARYNAPQMYWRAIGVSPDAVFEHTYKWNRIFNMPIYPIGQLYQQPTRHEIIRFRELAVSLGARGDSWWDWQEATAGGWNAIGQTLTRHATPPPVEYPLMHRGARGDVVVWIQEHLRSAGYNIPVDGIFGTRVKRAVEAFQTAKGLQVDGVMGPQTWQALLRYGAAPVVWHLNQKATTASAARRGVSGPPTAALPARRNELAGVDKHGRQ